MNRPQRREGEIGVPLEVVVQSSPGVAKDISQATSLQIFLLRPLGQSTVTYTAQFTNSGTDGKFRALTASGDLSLSGSTEPKIFEYYGQFVTDTETKISPRFQFVVVPAT